MTMVNALSHQIQSVARQQSFDDDSPMLTINHADTRRIAQQMGVREKQVEIAALGDNILPERYLRNLKTLSIADQLKLVESSICVVGLGGLGGLLSETLARMGIGRLQLIDGDVFEPHNLNRQQFSRMDNIGVSKAAVAAMHIKRINPGTEVISTDTYLTSENADGLLNQCNLAVDCLDTIQSRFTLQRAAKRAGIPMVSAAIAGMSGHITTIYPEDRGLESIYGTPEQLDISKGAETRLGCLAPAVNLVASIECAEAVKVLLNKSGTLKNSLLSIDLTDYTFETFRLS